HDAPKTIAATERAELKIAFPPNGAEVDLSSGAQALSLKALGGQLPLAWFVNGAPVAERDFRRQSSWKPDGAGFARVTVIDAKGATDSAFVRIGAGARFLVLQIIFLAIDKHHDVGVLLDRAGFAQIRELRALVVALLDRAGKLRQAEDRHIKLLGQRLQAGGDLGDFLHAAVAARFGAGEQLQIIDDQQIEPTLALQAARARHELGDRDAAGLVDVERDALHLHHRLRDAMKVIFRDVAAADLIRGDARLFGDDAGGELFGRHFQREEADDAAVDGLHRAI